jgi:hypothetical protein
MKPCNKWNRLFDTPHEDMPHEELRQKEILNHIKNCSECSTQSARWMELEKRLQAALGSMEVPDPTRREAAQLLMRLDHPKSRGTSVRFGLRLAWAGAAMALLLSVVSVLWQDKDTAGTEADSGAPILATIYTADDATPVVKEYGLNESLAAPRGGKLVARLGDDRFALATSGRVELLQRNRDTTRLRVRKGQVALEVSPRRKGAQFVVEVREFKIKVVGTRFSVFRGDAGGLEVKVQNGVVEVRDGRRQWIVRAGQSLRVRKDEEQGALGSLDEDEERLLDKLLDEEKPPKDTTEEHLESETDEGDRPQSTDVAKAKPDRKRKAARSNGDDIETLRALVAQGQLPEAEERLGTYLRTHRNDSEALLLLADSQRKLRKWKQAVATYLKVVDSPDAPRANRARFLAGTIYQENLGQHNRAVQMFDAYLKAADGQNLLRFEAQYRLARSLISIGQKERAQRVLRDIIANQGGTDLGASAKKLLAKTME